MKLEAIILKNFRSYRNEIRIPVGNFTAFIGKNDVGKSTILEALEIFFNAQQIDIEEEDVSIGSEDRKIIIGCEFSDFPEQLVIDEQAPTSLKEAFLINENGNLEIHKVYDFSGSKAKITVFARTVHPSLDKYSDLLQLSIAGLKARLKELGVSEVGVNLSSKPSIRSAIWGSKSSDELVLTSSYVSIDSKDTKDVWDKIQEHLPVFALFQADRASKDEDVEVQDPMKIAIKSALKKLGPALDEIKKKVEEEVIELAKRTVDKLAEIDPRLAKDLVPKFESLPKWESFKLSLTGDDSIPINKRGSGVRRLILLSFFRAEAERHQQEVNSPSVIYAVEEPEVSQHPDNQVMLAEALLELSRQDNRQVFITTHVPALANLIPVQDLRYIARGDDGLNMIQCGEDEGVPHAVANALGSLPDGRAKVLVYVEGPTDIKILKRANELIKSTDPSIVDICNNPEVIIIPTGGSTLRDWVMHNYLKELNLPQIHIYDGGLGEYQQQHDEINARSGSDRCFLTRKNEIENYIHPAAIQAAYSKDGISIEIPQFSDTDDVPAIVASLLHAKMSSGDRAYDDLEGKDKKEKEGRVKRVIVNSAIDLMTCEHLSEVDSVGEFKQWFTEIGLRVNPPRRHVGVIMAEVQVEVAPPAPDLL